MTPPLSELLAKRQALEREIQTTRRQERSHALSEVRRLMGENGLTLADLGSAVVQSTVDRKQTKKVAPKYRDPVSGATWSGRGLKPKWLVAALIDGKVPSDFAV